MLFGPVDYVALMSGLEHQFLLISVTSTLLAALLLVALTRYFGLVGAGFAIAGGILTANTATMALAKRRLGLRWWNKRYGAWLPQAVASLYIGFRRSQPASAIGRGAASGAARGNVRVGPDCGHLVWNASR